MAAIVQYIVKDENEIPVMVFATEALAVVYQATLEDSTIVQDEMDA